MTSKRKPNPPQNHIFNQQLAHKTDKTNAYLQIIKKMYEYCDYQI